mgnify:CR=1 FL=1
MKYFVTNGFTCVVGGLSGADMVPMCPGAFDRNSLALPNHLDKHSKDWIGRFFDYMYLHAGVSVGEAVDWIASALVRYFPLTGDVSRGFFGKAVFPENVFVILPGCEEF